MTLFRHISVIVAFGLSLPMIAFAQSGWSDAFGGAVAFDGAVTALAFDDQGRLYTGGNFEYAGGFQAHGLARWDGLKWDPLGDESMVITAIHFVGDELYIAGRNTDPNAQTNQYQVARWIENRVVPIGQFQEGCCAGTTIQALINDTRGTLYVGGNFHWADSLSATSLARWNGVQWDTVGASVRGPGRFDWIEDTVYDIVVQDTFVYIGGSFNEVGGKKAFRVARWDGYEWQSLGSGVGQTYEGAVYTLTMSAAGSLYAGGSFDVTGDNSANNIVQWDGSTWQPLGEGINGSVIALAAGEEYLYAAGRFTEAGGRSSSNIARWDGTSWQPLGKGLNGFVYALAIGPDGSLYAGGSFTEAGNVPAVNLARWTGTAWENVGANRNEGLNGSVRALAADNNSVYAGGLFTEAGGVNTRYIARWDGLSWSPLGTGLNNIVKTIALAPDGSLVAGGLFTEAGEAPANFIALWNGQQWQALADGFNDSVEDVAVASDGRIYATGRFTEAGGVPVNHIAMWDGEQWHPLGTGLNLLGLTLAIDANNLVYAGGYFNEAGGQAANRIATWNGSEWQALGTGVGQSFDYVADIDFSNNAVYIVGDFRKIGEQPASHIARWDGLEWENLSNGGHSVLTDLAFSEQGHLYVGGFLPGAGNYIARWNDGEWDRLGEGVNGLTGDIVTQNNEVVLGGSFTRAGGNSSNFFAVWNEESTTVSVPENAGIYEEAVQHSLYPNPFAEAATVALELPSATRVRVEVYDMLGNRVEVVADRHYSAGSHSITLHASHLASGSYMYRLVMRYESYSGVFHVVK